MCIAAINAEKNNLYVLFPRSTQVISGTIVIKLPTANPSGTTLSEVNLCWSYYRMYGRIVVCVHRVYEDVKILRRISTHVSNRM